MGKDYTNSQSVNETQAINIPAPKNTNPHVQSEYIFVGVPERAPQFVSSMFFVEQTIHPDVPVIKQDRDYKHLVAHSVFTKHREKVENALSGRKRLKPDDFAEDAQVVRALRPSKTFP